jgi:hypothetical protein
MLIIFLCLLEKMLEYKYPYFARTQSDEEAENIQATESGGEG